MTFSTQKEVSPSNIDEFGSTKLRAIQLGVYRVIMEKKKPFFDTSNPVTRLRNAKLSFDITLRFLSDVYSLSPMYMLLSLMDKMITPLQELVLLRMQSQLLSIVETGIQEGIFDRSAISLSLAAHITCALGLAAISFLTDAANTSFCMRVEKHFEFRILEAQLTTGLATSQSTISESSVEAKTASDCFSRLCLGVAQVWGMILQLGVVLQIVNSLQHGSILILLIMIEPVLRLSTNYPLYLTPRIVTATNDAYNRLRALNRMSEKKFRQDVISGGIVNYILSEYRVAQRNLGDVSTDPVEIQHQQEKSLFMHIWITLANNLPMLYYMTWTVITPSRMSLPALAVLQQVSDNLRQAFSSVQYLFGDLAKRIMQMDELYNIKLKAKELRDAAASTMTVPYPNPETSSEKGMGFEVRNLSFKYPGAEEGSAKALDNVSLSIKPGALVVIVGANGSGKSTIVKFLTRLYDTLNGDGEILLDGENINKYRLEDFRRAIASLTQDHHLYPLSLAENIGLGDPEHLNDAEMIQDAVKMGGSEGLIKRLASGLKTVLDNPVFQYSSYLSDDSPLKAEFEKLEKTSDVSGGERQRLVASRAFMRLCSGQVKFLVADEPSSALDPGGELELFNNLRNAREGKTMIFVTHRFAHLTAHADLLICMKEGRIVEQGSHVDLLAQQGEYARLYDIQARAFKNSQLGSKVEHDTMQ